MESNKQQETIDRLKQGLSMLNTLLQECREQDISLELHVVNTKGTPETVMYLHEDNDYSFKLEEAYKINKFT